MAYFSNPPPPLSLSLSLSLSLYLYSSLYLYFEKIIHTIKYFNYL